VHRLELSLAVQRAELGLYSNVSILALNLSVQVRDSGLFLLWDPYKHAPVVFP
jgi:hypothetical protein